MVITFPLNIWPISDYKTTWHNSLLDPCETCLIYVFDEYNLNHLGAMLLLGYGDAAYIQRWSPVCQMEFNVDGRMIRNRKLI